MMYKFKNGKIVDVKDFVIEKDLNKLFKVNLPSSLEEFNSGNGEGVWACSDEDTFNTWNNDNSSGIYFVKILNDSVYYQSLKYGTIIPIEMRGKNRPVAIFDELEYRYGKSKKEDVLRDLIRNY